MAGNGTKKNKTWPQIDRSNTDKGKNIPEHVSVDAAAEPEPEPPRFSHHSPVVFLGGGGVSVCPCSCVSAQPAGEPELRLPCCGQNWTEEQLSVNTNVCPSETEGASDWTTL